MEDKPIILLINEFERDLTKLVNESGIPAFFLESIFYKMHNTLSSLKENEILNTSKNYIKQNKSDNKKRGSEINDSNR